ncbi:25S rRNA (uracil2634-N3)-methyltransferase KNAG_0A05300 [Huiozyma naganishii CBS 8797]|uniref:25S rRNA (uridine-N(3))-methyltransferase BMT5-like domain-containing protein n=1 Tax=Huiozyma naganishii (strain ATCC MYA-139 / BCRC 22969 / CBS 8797 / KCTC 17520 / NBRC 10181 / NCYC 3082 / Yp74L-3) TaxID=1071383 RepID=J7S3U7_HUIN7|nr:hypothetical protein KNAG_0A05300 [Kazachstania naganishii CBS 8797]CCK68196.1 hypothetical protein KNAG_0A05300 [Kazachstania naganishii CBS 8797]
MNHKAQASQASAIKIKQQNKLKAKKQYSKKTMEQQKAQKQREASFIPFDKESTLLLVGEGDFSFAKSIVEKGYLLPENLIATSFDASITELKLKYPNSFEENYQYLVDAGVKIFFQIDATNLIRSFKLSKHTPWKKQLGKEWAHKFLNNIMFNFPHTGKGVKDQDRNIRDHQELVFGYFDSAKQLFNLVNSYIKQAKTTHTQGYDLGEQTNGKGTGLDDICGKIIISTFSGEPYSSWEIKTLAKDNDLQLDRSCKFEWSNYSSYHHKRTNSEQDTTKPAEMRDARIYIFKEYDRTRKTTSRTKEDRD